MAHKINNTEVEIIKGDITQLDAEAIVNPANNYLMHGGGLAAAIVRAGGQIIQQESKKIGFVPTGHAVYTTGGHLKAQYVIHAVGPRYKDGNSGEAEKLASAVKTALDIADKKKLKSIALPAITKAMAEFLSETAETTLEKVTICLFDDEAYSEFEKQVKTIPEQKTKTKPKKKEAEEPVKEVKKSKEKIKAQTGKAKSTKVKIEKTHASAKKTAATRKTK